MAIRTIREMMEASGKSYEQIRVDAGVSIHTVYRARDENRIARSTTREKIAKAIGVNAEEIENGGPSKGLTGAVETWATYELVPEETLGAIVNNATGTLDILMGTGIMLLDILTNNETAAPDAPNGIDRLRVKAADEGLTIRVLLGNPSAPHAFERGEAEGMGGQEFVDRLTEGVGRWGETVDLIQNAQLRTFNGPYLFSQIMTDQRALVWFHRPHQVGTKSRPAEVNEHHPWWPGLTEDFNDMWKASA